MQVNTQRNDAFDRDCAGMDAVNADNLRVLLWDNQNTEYGRRYHFADIQNADEYRARVPIITYDDVQQDVERMFAGEENVLTAYPIRQYILTSGTSGQSKRIPLSEEALERYGNIKDRINCDVMGLYGSGLRLQIVTYRTDPAQPPEKEVLFSVANERNLYRNGWLDPEQYVGGKTLYFQKDMTRFFYPKLWAAFAEEKIVTIESPFLYDHLLLFRFLEEHWQQIVEDMRQKRISMPEGLPRAVQEYLLALPVDEARLDHVERECRKGGEGIARRLWPSLRAICGIRGSIWSAEDTLLEYYTRGVGRHFFCFVSSECFMGIPIKMDEAVYALMPRSAFYEFLPYDSDESDTRTLLPHELEVGRDYEIVLSNFSGLYRYRTYDVVRMEGWYGQSPLVSFRLRRNLALNLAGEKFDSFTLQHAGTLLSRELDLSECSFALEEKTVPGRYLCFAETDRPVTDELLRRGDEALERVLTQLSGDYADLRNLQCIAPPKMIFVRPGAHLAVKHAQGGHAEQNKPLQILRSDAQLSEMKSHILHKTQGEDA